MLGLFDLKVGLLKFFIQAFNSFSTQLRLLNQTLVVLYMLLKFVFYTSQLII